MSFYMVPTVLYQTQQKLKKKNVKHKKKKKHPASNDDTTSLKSSSTDSTVPSLNHDIPEGVSTPTTSMDTHEEIVPDHKPIVVPHPKTPLLALTNLAQSPQPKPESLRSSINKSQESLHRPDFSKHPLDPQLLRSPARAEPSPSSPILNNYHQFQINQQQLHATLTQRKPDEDYFDPEDRHNSVLSIHSGSSAPSFRRNSSLTSATSFTNQPKPSPLRFARRLSSPFLHDKKQPNRPSPLLSPHEEPKKDVVFKPAYTDKSPLATDSDVTPTPDNYFSHKLPQFKPLTRLDELNSLELLTKTLYAPAFQVFRYNNYLDIVSGHIRSDPVNFANIRYHSLLKFIHRHRNTGELKHLHDTGELVLGDDIRTYESLLAYELLSTRTFLREYIRIGSMSGSKVPLVSCEELVQVNFTNYIRYILSLPEMEDTSQLSDLDRDHYRIKHIFTAIQEGLTNVKREENGVELIDATYSQNLLLQSIAKVSYEFILLEVYHIHILDKLNNNSIIESRIARRLFNLFFLNLALKNFESIKVLHYNSFFSAQYGWFLALTTPFVRVIEANIYSEEAHLVNNPEKYSHYRNLLTDADMKHYHDLDHHLHEHFFKNLDIKNDFDHFKELTPKKLVDLHKAIDTKAAGTKGDPAPLRHKPQNFEFYSGSLAQLQLETFHAIQLRDLLIQLTPTNFRTVLSEFYRILKKGGTLEVPLLKLGIGKLSQLPLTRNNSSVSNNSHYLDIDLLAKYDMVPNFTSELLDSLHQLFGSKNIKFSLVLLSSSSEVHRFLVEHAGLCVYEIFGDLDAYCLRYNQDESFSPRPEDLALSYFFYIRAEKN